MFYKSLLIISFLMISNLSFAQRDKDILMTVEGKQVSAKEFARVYKKNLNLVQDETQKNVDGYLQLFVDYKLKVTEAYAQDLHKDPNYEKEFSKYQDQLSRKYIYEDRVTEEIAKEAFDRGLYEIDVDHILVKSNFNDAPKDTLIAYNKLAEVREKALKGEDFNTLAAQFSEEPGSKERKGKLGYFSAFDMVYPFESAAYKTEVGKISEIFRTSYGYHFLKVNDKRMRAAKITVSHIMITDNKETRTFDPKERIEEIALLLKQGETFESLAKEYSDDKNSAKRGGELLPFTKGSLRSKLFEQNAYKLKTVGEISEPFKSEYGWHIVRLEKVHTIPVFADEKEGLERRVKDGNRSKLVTSVINKKIIDKYGYKEGTSYLPYFENYVSDELFDRKWEYTPIPEKDDAILFTIGTKSEKFNDFAKYVEKRQRRSRITKNKKVMLADYYYEFKDTSIKDYFKVELEKENDEYAAVINEYRDGLLIFDVMQKNVWEKARTDSTGLKKFYEQVKGNYKWGERVDGVIVSSSDKATAQKAKELIKAEKSVEEIKETLNKDGRIGVLVSEGTFELGSREIPDSFKPNLGISEVISDDGTFKVIEVKKIVAPTIKKLDEIRGRILSDYQNEVEKQWMESLRKKYNVKVNKKVLKKLKKQLDS